MIVFMVLIANFSVGTMVNMNRTAMFVIAVTTWVWVHHLSTISQDRSINDICQCIGGFQ